MLDKQTHQKHDINYLLTPPQSSNIQLKRKEKKKQSIKQKLTSSRSEDGKHGEQRA